MSQPMEDAGKLKPEQFEAFIQLIEESATPHWVDIARAIGISADTITDWKKDPRAQAAIRKGIQHALQQMEETGGKDWKMWAKKLGMLGVAELTKTDLTSDGEKLQGPIVYIPKEVDE